VRGVDFKMSPKMAEKLTRQQQLLTRRASLAAAAEKIKAEANNAATIARFAEASVMDMQKPLTIAESDMIADEIAELEAKLYDARLRLSALSNATLPGGEGRGLIAFSPRALAILRSPSACFVVPQRASAKGALWENYKMAFLDWWRVLTRDPAALRNFS
jgi:hypothetical protein